MSEVFKWVAALGAGAAATFLQFLQGVPSASWWQAMVIAALVRIVSWAVAKLPVKA